MGKIKESNDAQKTHKLTEREFNYLKLLTSALTFHTLKDRLISGYLYYVCSSRFGYSETVNLLFEIDLDSDNAELKVTEVKNEDLEKALEK